MPTTSAATTMNVSETSRVKANGASPSSMMAKDATVTTRDPNALYRAP